jgi:hypothetical protein
MGVPAKRLDWLFGLGLHILLVEANDDCFLNGFVHNIPSCHFAAMADKNPRNDQRACPHDMSPARRIGIGFGLILIVMLVFISVVLLCKRKDRWRNYRRDLEHGFLNPTANAGQRGGHTACGRLGTIPKEAAGDEEPKDQGGNPERPENVQLPPPAPAVINVSAYVQSIWTLRKLTAFAVHSMNHRLIPHPQVNYLGGKMLEIVRDK